jgi:hypothetical protein
MIDDLDLYKNKIPSTSTKITMKSSSLSEGEGWGEVFLRLLKPLIIL